MRKRLLGRERLALLSIILSIACSPVIAGGVALSPHANDQTAVLGTRTHRLHPLRQPRSDIALISENEGEASLGINSENSTNTMDKLATRTVLATVYWVGESASQDNGYISNVPSAWDKDSVARFGCIDSPVNRSCTPKHNSFYAALPAAEYSVNGLIPGAREQSPWWPEAVQLGAAESLFKGRWIEVTHKSKTVYVQWHDVGPFEEKDYAYVFGTKSPANTRGLKAGIDLSPDAAKSLGINGSGEVTWRFVNRAEVPHGPWLRYQAITSRTYW